MIKKQVNIRLNIGTIDYIKDIQDDMKKRGFKLSQGDVIEEAILQLHKNLGLRPDRIYEDEE